jgi:hypothetical protein
LILIFAAAAALCTVSVADARPGSLLGKWRLNLKQSETLPGEEPPVELIMAITEDTPTRFSWTVTVRMADGSSGATRFTGAIDGKPYPVEGRPPGSTSSFRWMLDGALKQVSEGPGGLSIESCMFSADMRRMDCDARQTAKDGQTWTYEEVFDRM